MTSTTRIVLPILLVVALAAVTGGCASPAGPTGARKTEVDPTPVPTAPAEALLRASTIEQDGVRVTIELERNPMPAGEATWVSTTVTNVGSDDMVWFHDGCAVAVGVGGTMAGTKWRPGIGGQRGAALEYRSFALERLGVDDGSISIRFTEEARVGQKGTYGCSDIGIGDKLEPGDSIEQRARWDGSAGTLLGPPPTGLVRLTGSFRYYWREAAGEPENITTGVVDLPLDAWIEQSGPGGIHPAEAIDIALSDVRLANLLESRDLWNANEPLIRFDPSDSVWQVGLLEHGDRPFVHLVLVDGATGTLRGWVERSWDFDVDGFP
jgi:hypothetical protein